MSSIFRRWFRYTKKSCSFCGKHHSDVAKLIAGRGVSICNECVLICSGVLMKECEEYRNSQLLKMRELLGTTSKTDPKAAPSAPPPLPKTKGKPG
jgi:hypothetical protein